ncbi:hypothetical protein SAMN05443550_101101 [Pedobacter hartonius]|uniref:Uncharacterized protein n=1 Tax=Pedobacter hartonius TaxID=425514 RepID=A0A1H3W4W1_9SPHI|nr:hypothetical protein SAMN05443550_101101 [Pedobacter hartonius]
MKNLNLSGTLLIQNRSIYATLIFSLLFISQGNAQNNQAAAYGGVVVKR